MEKVDLEIAVRGAAEIAAETFHDPDNTQKEWFRAAGNLMICCALLAEQETDIKPKDVAVAELTEAGATGVDIEYVRRIAGDKNARRTIFSLSYMPKSAQDYGLKIGKKSRTLDVEKFVSHFKNQATERNLV